MNFLEGLEKLELLGQKELVDLSNMRNRERLSFTQHQPKSSPLEMILRGETTMHTLIKVTLKLCFQHILLPNE